MTNIGERMGHQAKVRALDTIVSFTCVYLDDDDQILTNLSKLKLNPEAYAHKATSTRSIPAAWSQGDISRPFFLRHRF